MFSYFEYLQYRSLTVSSISLSQVPQLTWDFEPWVGEPDYASLASFRSDEIHFPVTVPNQNWTNKEKFDKESWQILSPGQSSTALGKSRWKLRKVRGWRAWKEVHHQRAQHGGAWQVEEEAGEGGGGGGGWRLPWPWTLRSCAVHRGEINCHKVAFCAFFYLNRREYLGRLCIYGVAFAWGDQG